jgi:hypothetical protein
VEVQVGPVPTALVTLTTNELGSVPVVEGSSTSEGFDSWLTSGKDRKRALDERCQSFLVGIVDVGSVVRSTLRFATPAGPKKGYDNVRRKPIERRKPCRSIQKRTESRDCPLVEWVDNIGTGGYISALVRR